MVMIMFSALVDTQGLRLHRCIPLLDFLFGGFSIIVYQQARNLGYFLLSGECQKGKRKRNKNIILVTIEKKKKKNLNHDKRNVTFLAIW